MMLSRKNLMISSLAGLLALSSVANAAYLTTAAGQITSVSADSAWGFLPAIGAADESGIIGDLHSQHDGSTEHQQLWVSNVTSAVNNEWSATFAQGYELGSMWVWNSRWSADGTGGFKDVEVYYTDEFGSEQQLMGPGFFGSWEFAISNPTAYDEDTPRQTEIPFGGVTATGVRLQQVTDWGAAFGSGGLEEVRFNLFGTLEPQETFTWARTEGGNWNVAGNWTPPFGGAPPNGNVDAIFPDSTSGPSTVYTDVPITVRSVQFNNSSNSYAVAGLGSINLGTDTPEEVIDSISAVGTHEFQVNVNLLADATVYVASDSTLIFNNALDLGGFTLTKTGDGEMAIRNDLITSGGMIDLLGGTISGNGTISGDLINGGGTISPGNSSSTSAVVPEPTSIALAAVGALLLLWKRRKVSL